MKEQLWQLRTATVGKPPGPIDKFCIKYLDNDSLTVELFDEDQTLSSVSILQSWVTSNRPIVFTVDAKRPASRQDKNVGVKISSLIDYGLHQLDKMYNFEVSAFRRKMVRVRRVAIRQRNYTQYLFAPTFDPREVSPRCVGCTRACT